MKSKRVADPYLYWEKEPPEMSARCKEWLVRIKGGWIPNRRIRGFGYDEASEFFGVYIWEYLHILRLALYK